MEGRMNKKIICILITALSFLILAHPANAGPNNAACVSHTIPLIMTVGEYKTVSVTVKNTGTTTWTPTGVGSSYYYIAVPPSIQSKFGVSYVALSSSVTPGSNVTFTFTITAPATPGTYQLKYQMVQQGVEFFGEWCGPASITVTRPNNAACVSHTIPLIMTVGEHKTVSVKVKNTGTTTWTPTGTGSNYYYIAVVSGNPSQFGVPYVALPASVPPGSNATFTFAITAPITPGTYQLKYQMVQEGVEFFGEWCGPALIRVSNDNANRFARVLNNKLYLNHKEFIIKGTNYLGGTYFEPIIQNNIVYEGNWFRKFDDAYWNEAEIEKELRFLKYNLNLNTIRVFLPEEKGIESLVKWHNFPPWFLSDGSINPMYLENIKKLLDIAKRNNLKVILVLFQNKGVFFQDDPVPPGSQKEQFYFRHLESLIPELKDREEILAYEVVNEPIPLTFWQQGTVDRQMASFIVRMTKKVWELDSNHLTTLSHVAFYRASDGRRPWFSPVGAVVEIDDIGYLNNGKTLKLIDYVDFIAPHYYDGISFIQGTTDTDGKLLIEDIKNKTSKPIILGEFGEKRADPQKQNQFYSKAIANANTYSLTGLINWGDLPYPGKTFCPTCYDANAWPLFDDNLNPLPAATTYKTVYSGTFSPDTTPPTTPVVADEGQYTTKRDQLYASWTSSDPESGIAEYQYRITQDSPTGTVIIRNWTSTGTYNYVTAGALSLTDGKTYYFSVKAKNGAGLWSAVGYSDGITVVLQQSQTPWKTNGNGALYTNFGWNYTMGYHFTPQKSGRITKLGGFFNGAKTVYLWDKTTGALLAQANVTSANSWNYTSISTVSVQAGKTYTVAVYLGGSGGSYRAGIATLPKIYADIKIEGSTYNSGTARPTNNITTYMYGQVDIEFMPN